MRLKRNGVDYKIPIPRIIIHEFKSFGVVYGHMLLPGEGLVLFLSVLLLSAPGGGTILEVQPAFEY